MKTNTSIPKEKCLDNTLRLYMEGYLFMPSRFAKFQTDIFRTRLMGKKVICMYGEESAKIFYDNKLFTRKGAIPKRIQNTLFGKKAIQMTVGEEHRHRKNLFMSLMTPSNIDKLVQITKEQWRKNSKRWLDKDYIILFDEVTILLCQAACQWAGVPLKRYEVKHRAMDLAALVDSFGAAGLRHYKGRCARKRCEKWIKGIIEDVRSGLLKAPKDSILYKVAFYKGPDGRLLEANLAGIEMINVIRPITAIATYITFGAHALHLYPECRKKIQEEQSNYLHMFAQEIRRFYPFGPFLGAKVRSNFTFKDCHFKKGDLVFLDIYGTNHDPRIWKKPYQFYPEHFKYYDGNPYDFIPQGGGDYYTGQRCPGEWITIELIKASMDFLANHLDYKVPPQDLGYCLRRMPAIPNSRFVISIIRRFEF